MTHYMRNVHHRNRNFPFRALTDIREVDRMCGRTLYKVHELGKRSFMEPLWNISDLRESSNGLFYIYYEVRDQDNNRVRDKQAYLADMNIGVHVNNNYVFPDSISAMDFLQICLEQ